MPERFGGFEPPDEPTPPTPGIVNLGFNDLKEFPTGAYDETEYNNSSSPSSLGVSCSLSMHTTRAVCGR